MRLYTAFCHAFMPPLYAVTSCQGLYQVYATRAPLGFIPGRCGDRRLPLVGSVRKSGRRRGILAKSPRGRLPPIHRWSTGGLGEKIGAPPPGAFRPNIPPGAGFIPDRSSSKRTCNIYNHLPNHHIGGGLHCRLLYNGLCRGTILLYVGAL